MAVAAMLLGRLEIFTILVLLMPGFRPEGGGRRPPGATVHPPDTATAQPTLQYPLQAAAPVGDEVEPNRLLVVEHPVDQLPRLAEDLGSIALAAGLHRFTANHVQGWGGETLAALRLVKH